MQTFLPYRDVDASIATLDYRRLGKQRVEALQVLRTLAGITDGWRNHPAVRMWRGHERALAVYGIAACRRWTDEFGYKDSCLVQISDIADTHFADTTDAFPSWFTDDDGSLFVSHQSNLLRKLPEHYGPLFPGVPDHLPYIWPV